MKTSFVETEAKQPKQRSESKSRDTSLKSNHLSPEKPSISGKTGAAGSKLRLLKQDKARNTGSPVPMSQIRNGKVCIDGKEIYQISIFTKQTFLIVYRLIRTKGQNRWQLEDAIKNQLARMGHQQVAVLSHPHRRNRNPVRAHIIQIMPTVHTPENLLPAHRNRIERKHRVLIPKNHSRVHLAHVENSHQLAHSNRYQLKMMSQVQVQVQVQI